MKILIELNGMKRKKLVQAISETVNEEAVYKGPPSYAYEVGKITIDREGTIVAPEDESEETLSVLLDVLRKHGFGAKAEDNQQTAPKPVTNPNPNPDVDQDKLQLIVQLPLAGFTETSLENLRLIIASKALLIKKALSVSDLSIGKTEETVDFPWFDRKLSSDELTAYTNFLTLLSDMAKRQSRVLATEKPIANEKYAFRCFLLRLGMIGEEYADTRRILLRNLTGNGSMKSGEHKPPKEKTLPVPTAVAKQDAPNVPEPTSEPENPPKEKSRFSLKKLFSTLKTMAMD